MSLYAKIKETVSEAAIFGMAPLFTRLLGFFLTFVYTASFETHEFGELSLLLTTEAFASQILQFGLTTSYFRSYFDHDDEARRRLVTSTTVWFLVVVNTFFVAAAVPFAGWYGTVVFGEPHTDLVMLMVVMTALDTINNLPFLIFKAQRRSKLYVAVQWIAALAQFSSIVVLVAVLGMGVKGALLGMVVGVALQTLLYYVTLRRDVDFAFSFAELRPLLALGIPMVFNAFATKILIVSDRFFINHYFSQAEVGLYALADRFAAILPILIANPFSLVWPAMRFQVMKDEDADEYYSRVLTYLCYLSLYFGLGVAALAPDVIRVVAPPQYWDAARVVPLLVLFYVLMATAKGVNVGLMVEKKAYWNPVIVVATAVLNTALNFLLIPRYGMMGAAWSTVFSYAFFNWFRWYMSTRYHPVAYEWGRILKMIGVASALYALSTLVVLSNPYISFALRFAIAVPYPFVLSLLGFYDERERARFAEIWRAGRARALRLFNIGGV